MKVVKADPKNKTHLAMYNTFCLHNQIVPSIAALLETEQAENEYSKKLYFFVEKEQTILESCNILIEKDLKKAFLSVFAKQVPSKKNIVLTLLKECIEYLFLIESVEDICLQIKEPILDTTSEKLGYDILSLGFDSKGNCCYSIEKNF